MAQLQPVKATIPERSSIPSNPAKTSKDIVYPRWFGGVASCVAVVVSHPFDLGKIQLQTVHAAKRARKLLRIDEMG